MRDGSSRRFTGSETSARELDFMPKSGDAAEICGTRSSWTSKLFRPPFLRGFDLPARVKERFGEAQPDLIFEG